MPFLANWIRYCCPFKLRRIRESDRNSHWKSVLLLTGYISLTQSSTVFQWHFDDGVAWFTYCSIVKWQSLENKIAVFELSIYRSGASWGKKVNYIKSCVVFPLLTASWKMKMWCDLLCIITIRSGNRFQHVMNQTLWHCNHLTVESICLCL